MLFGSSIKIAFFNWVDCHSAVLSLAVLGSYGGYESASCTTGMYMVESMMCSWCGKQLMSLNLDLGAAEYLSRLPN